MCGVIIGETGKNPFIGEGNELTDRSEVEDHPGGRLMARLAGKFLPWEDPRYR